MRLRIEDERGSRPSAQYWPMHLWLRFVSGLFDMSTIVPGMGIYAECMALYSWSQLLLLQVLSPCTTRLLLYGNLPVCVHHLPGNQLPANMPHRFDVRYPRLVFEVRLGRNAPRTIQFWHPTHLRPTHRRRQPPTVCRVFFPH